MDLPRCSFKLDGRAPGGAPSIEVKPPQKVYDLASPQEGVKTVESEGGDKPLPSLELRKEQPAKGFNNIKSVGYYPYASQYPEHSKYSLHRHEMWSKFPELVKKEFDVEPKFAGVNPDAINVMTALMKYDTPPVWEFRNDPLWATAVQVVTKNLQTALVQPTITYEDALELVDETKAPGFPWNVIGIRSKGAAMRHEEFEERVKNGREIPIYKTSPKHEWKEISDIMNHKIRTFIIEPVDSMVQKKILYHNQNEALKNYWWSQYGMSPFNGGFDRMATTLLKGYGIESGDVVGFDRRFPVMREVYEMRNAGIRNAGATEDEMNMAEHQKFAMENVHVLFPDGTIVVLKWSNPSGSNNTTSDNIIGGMLMHTFKYLVAVRDLQSSDTSVKVPWKWFTEKNAFMFGDDYIAAVPVEMKLTLDFTWVQDFWKYYFNYEIRDFQAGRASEEELSKHKFLGGTFTKFRDSWIPSFNEDRLRDSFCWNIDSMETSALINKLYSLIVLSFSHEDLFAYMVTAYRMVLRHLAKLSNPSPEIAAAIVRGAPSITALASFYTGQEDGVTFDAGPFLTSVMEEGRKKIIYFQSRNMDGNKKANGIKATLAKQGTYPSADVTKLKQRLDSLVKLVGEQRGTGVSPGNGSVAKGKTRGNNKSGNGNVGRGGGSTPHVSSASVVPVRKETIVVAPKKKVVVTKTAQKGKANTGGGAESVASNVMALMNTPIPKLRQLFRDSRAQMLVQKMEDRRVAYVKSLHPTDDEDSYDFVKVDPEDFQRRAQVIAAYEKELRKQTSLAIAPNSIRAKSTKAHKVSVGYHEQRLSKVGKAGSKERASWLKNAVVGAAEGTVYHGSPMSESTFSREGKEGIRMSGHQLLSTTVTGGAPPAPGWRFDVIPFTPAAIGGRMSQMALEYEQCKLNHCFIVWRPSVGTAENGNIIAYYRADTGAETQEIGLTEYDQASAHQNFISTSIWNPATMDIDPQDANLRYADSFNASFANDIQGQISIEAGNNLLGNKTYGDWYIEYDIEFWSPVEDPSISFQATTICTLKWNAYTTMTSGNTVVFNGEADAAGVASFNFLTPPPTSEYMVIFCINNYTSGTNSTNLQWNSANNQDATNFTGGQCLYGRFLTKGPINWTNGNTALMLYRDQDSASGSVGLGANQAQDGQCVWLNTDAAPATYTLLASCRFIPLNINA